MGRTQIEVLPSALVAVNATLAPSGDSTGGPAESPIRLSVVFSGGIMTVRVTCADGTERLRKVPAMTASASATTKAIAQTKTKKFTPEIDAQLYDEFVAVAERNGQTKRHVLEQALGFYLHNVVPSQHLVRPEVMDAFEQSVARNRDLLQRLAK